MHCSIPGNCTLIISCHPFPSCDNQKCLQKEANVSSGAIACLAENQCNAFSKIYASSVHLPPSDICPNATVFVSEMIINHPIKTATHPASILDCHLLSPSHSSSSIFSSVLIPPGPFYLFYLLSIYLSLSIKKCKFHFCLFGDLSTLCFLNIIVIFY